MIVAMAVVVRLAEALGVNAFALLTCAFSDGHRDDNSLKAGSIHNPDDSIWAKR